MTLDAAVLRFAGCAPIASLVPALRVRPGWIGLASFAGFCPVARVFRQLGLQPGVAFA